MIPIIKDLIIIVLSAILFAFYLNIQIAGSSSWTETGWILWGETITIAAILFLGIFFLIKDFKERRRQY